MSNLSCIIVDDEPLALEQMTSFVKKVDFLDLKKVFDNAIEALNYIQQNPVDLAFLDIEMDEFSGIDLLESLDNKPFVILTTAYDQYALKGYELHVTDYLLKPISYQRFIRAVNHVYELSNTPREIAKVVENKVIQNEKRDFVFLKTEYKLQKVKFEEILFVKSMGNYMIVKTNNLGSVYTLMSFKEIEKVLPSNEFIRIHKSYIIPIERIETINKSSVEIAGEIVPIGDSYRQLFFAMIKKLGYL